ncbi:ORF38 [Ranid herpesvirus 1]|uniref:ORF38 n=1 Tax=Ranid herpesvirus 1 TaxID=85655 RepID=Q14VS0_9VIRU|nr:ORF38 [Ranid herpesvirus 1]ABG25804.1 ORF38 [Ranid herpesvirus 1]
MSALILYASSHRVRMTPLSKLITQNPGVVLQLPRSTSSRDHSLTLQDKAHPALLSLIQECYYPEYIQEVGTLTSAENGTELVYVRDGGAGAVYSTDGVQVRCRALSFQDLCANGWTTLGVAPLSNAHLIPSLP